MKHRTHEQHNNNKETIDIDNSEKPEAHRVGNQI